jgi:mono/diheme cytochrome c family protein
VSPQPLGKVSIEEVISEDPALVRLIYQYLAWAAFWLVAASAVGLVLSLKLNYPDFLNSPFTVFGRLRPVHTNTLFWGWTSLAMVGLCLFGVPRTSRTPTYGRITSPAAPAATPEGFAPSSSTSSALGAQIYGNNCATCHQPEGTGVPGAFPPLKGDPVVLSADPSVHIRVILQGVYDKEIGGTKYAAPMPSFAGQLKDEEIAAVASHERTSWGNQAPIVTAADVAKIRAEK